MRSSPEVRRHAVQLVLDEGRTAAAVAGELGLAASTVRRWVRLAWRREEWWQAQVTPVFRFLTDAGFSLTDVHGPTWWEICAVYRADPVAVLVVYSVEFEELTARLAVHNGASSRPDAEPPA